LSRGKNASPCEWACLGKVNATSYSTENVIYNPLAELPASSKGYIKERGVSIRLERVPHEEQAPSRAEILMKSNSKLNGSAI
jgi:hypothetical protein